LRCNEQIRISPIRLINDQNEQVGIVPTMEALRMAREVGFDLVEVSPMEKPPVCRIMDYGKWKYKQKKKEQKAHAAHVTQLKELRLKSVRIDKHDQDTKLNQAKQFLAEGHKVQFNLMFRGREMAHVDLGRTLMEKFKSDLGDISKPEREPKLEGKRMIMILTPKGHHETKPGESAKPKKAAPAAAAAPAAPKPAAAPVAAPPAAKPA
jgi:translation initiation factor IF-3